MKAEKKTQNTNIWVNLFQDMLQSTEQRAYRIHAKNDNILREIEQICKSYLHLPPIQVAEPDDAKKNK